MTEKDLLQAADAALYSAKREGRDRVVLPETTALTDIPADLIRITQSKA